MFQFLLTLIKMKSKIDFRQRSTITLSGFWKAPSYSFIRLSVISFRYIFSPRDEFYKKICSEKFHKIHRKTPEIESTKKEVPSKLQSICERLFLCMQKKYPNT